MTSIVDMVKHYQRSIDKSMDNQARLLHCIEKLHKLPITVEHLQETGIGRTVNGLRKYDGEVGYASKALVTKWKQMVAAEEPEEDMGEQQQQQMTDAEPNDEADDDDEDDDVDNAELRLEIDETENIEPEQVEINEQLVDEKTDDHQRHSSGSDKKHKDGRTKHRSHHNDRHRKERFSSHSGKGGDDDDSKKSQSHSRSRDKDKHTKADHSTTHHSSGDKHKEKKHSSSSSSRHHHSSSSTKHDTNSTSTSKREKKEDKEQPSHDSKRDYSKTESESEKRSGSKSGEESTSKSKRRRDDEKSSPQKETSNSRHRKEDDRPVKKRKQNDIDDMVIDSSMGASFADALGMLDFPSPSKKKSQRQAKSTSSSSSAKPESKSSKSESKEKSSTDKPSSSSNSKPREISPTASSSSYTSKEPKAPLLLTKRPKLEPLPDITSEILPSVPIIISNNYKPLPLNPTVMDCVYNQPKQRNMTDEEALSYSIMSKKERTKVFSGQKTGYRGEVPRLYDLCIRVLQENLDDLEFTGGIPYEILKPILERATMQQLLAIEHYNPYLVEETDDLWQTHCKRHFRGRQPEELESWRELFLRLQDEQQAKFEKLTKNIKAAQEKSVPVKKTKLAFVDNYIKPPRNVMKKQERYGTNNLVSASPATRVAALDGHVGVKLAKPGDTKLRVANAIRDAAPTQPPRVNPNRKAPLMQKTLMSIKKLKQR